MKRGCLPPVRRQRGDSKNTARGSKSIEGTRHAAGKRRHAIAANKAIAAYRFEQTDAMSDRYAVFASRHADHNLFACVVTSRMIVAAAF